GHEGLGLVRAALAPQAPDLLGERLDAAPHLVALGTDPPVRRVELDHALDRVGGARAAPVERGDDRLGLGTDAPQVEHGHRGYRCGRRRPALDGRPRRATGGPASRGGPGPALRVAASAGVASLPPWPPSRSSRSPSPTAR